MYEKEGYIVDKVEHHNTFSGKKKDYLNFIDILVFNNEEIVGVQETSWGQTSARRRKILASPLAYDWLQCSNRRIEIIGHKKPDKEKGRHRWEHKIIEVTLEDFVNGRPSEDST